MKNLEEAFQDDIQDEIQDLLSRHFLCSVLKSHSLSDKKPRGFINTIHPPSLVCMPPSFQCLHRCLRLVVKWQIDELSRGQQWEIRWYRGQRDSKFAGWSAERETAIWQKKLTEPQEDRRAIEKMRSDVMLMSSGMEERGAAGDEHFRVTGRDERRRCKARELQENTGRRN